MTTRLLVLTLLFAGCVPTPRPTQEAVLPAVTGGFSPTPGLDGQPDRAEQAVIPAPRRPGVISGPDHTTPAPTGTRPAATGTPRTSAPLRGIATRFRSPSGVSAAGPALRAALGPGWRGTRVRVCAGERCVSTVLGDTMAADRLIDLHAPLFARLAPLWKGVLKVEVTGE